MKATFSNLDENMTAFVTPISNGFVVKLIDWDSENIVATKIYPKGKGAQAVACAREWVFGKDELISVQV